MQYGNSLYGQSGYASTREDENRPGEHLIDLMTYLPDFYQDNIKMRELQTLLGYEVDEGIYCTKDVLNQSFITIATWGLDRWEKEFGLQTDKSMAYDRRREILLAKLRGSGTTTKEMIKNVAIAFSGGEVAIHEYPKDYSFVIQFIGVKGIPQNMAGLIAAVEEIKPAHLACSFKYTYTAWCQISNSTWGSFSQKTWGDLRIYEGE